MNAKTKAIKNKIQVPRKVLDKLIKLEKSAIAPTPWQNRSQKEFQRYRNEVNKKYNI